MHLKHNQQIEKGLSKTKLDMSSWYFQGETKASWSF